MDRKDILNDQEINIPKNGYANLTNDYMFKRIFGSEECKDILITFLNHIIGDCTITNVSFQNTEHLGPSVGDRKAVFDISCKTDRGEEFIVEMQNAPQHYFRDRSLFYTCYPIIHQAAKAKEEFLKQNGNTIGFNWDFCLKPVKLIAVLNFSMTHAQGWDEHRYHSSYHIREDLSNEILHDKVQYIYLELGRFDKEVSQLETNYDKWMYLFKNMPKMKSRPQCYREKDFDRLFDIAGFINFTPEQFVEYQNSEKMIYDYKNTIDYAEQRGLEQGRAEGHILGRAEGLTEGRAEEKRTIAREMLSRGIDPQLIIEVTGITEAELSDLKG